MAIGLAAALALGLLLGPIPARGVTSAAQPTDDAAGSRLSVVHGVVDAGPLDVYVDGGLALIGLVYPEASGDLLLSGGEHQFAVVPSGAGLDAALAAGTLALAEDGRSFATLFGPASDISVGLFAVDERPLEAGRARFRVIGGAPDSGEIVPLFAGGDAISEPLGFGDASEYAVIDAGTYDFDIIDAATGISLLPLPQTVLAEGTATDIVLVGQVADATLQALVLPTPVEVRRASGSVAQIVEGGCSQPGNAVADLGIVRVGEGDAVGVADAPLVAQSFGLAGVAFADLTASRHAVTVSPGDQPEAAPIACGEIGGRLTETGALVIALRAPTSGEAAGVAVLAPGLVDAATTGVSVFLTAGASGAPVSATPEAAIE